MRERIIGPVVGGDGDPSLSADGEEGGWYDPQPLLASLRAPEAASLARDLGVADLSSLPLYDLDIHVDLPAATFQVEETVWFTNTTGRALSDLALRVFVNDVAPASGPQVALRYGRCERVECDVQWDGGSLVVARLLRPLVPGGRARIRLGLEGRLQRLPPERMDFMAQGIEGLSAMSHGAKKGDYGLVSVSEGTASLASFFAVIARYRDGDWVRHNDSTMGDLGTDALAHYRATVHTTPDARVLPVGVLTTESRPGQARIVAAAVRDFTVLVSSSLVTRSVQVGDVAVRSHFLPAHERAGQRVLQAASRALDLFQRQFGRYPYRDLDVVEAPLIGGAGGVEFSGLVTVATMFYRKPGGGRMAGMFNLTINGQPGKNPMSGLIDRMLEFVTVHEVAHQYWHGLVGSDSRRHPFADEGLAQFSSILYLERVHGRERAQADRDMQVAMNYRTMRMMGHSDGPVLRPVAGFDSAVQYAGLVYGKGPLMYLPMREALGETAFFRALRAYVERYRFRVAPGDGFVDVLAKQHPAAARPIIRRWLHEAHGDEDVGGDWQVQGMPGVKASEMHDLRKLLRQLEQGGEMPAGLPNDVQQLLRGLQAPAIDG